MRYLVSTLALAAFLTGGAAFAQTPRAPQPTHNHATAARSVGTKSHKAKKHHHRHGRKTARHAAHTAPVR